MRRAAALTLVLLCVAAPAAAAEIIDSEGGYRLEVPKGWEGFRHGERVELIDPNGTIKKNTMVPGTAKMWLRPIPDPDFWFEQLLNRDETRDVRRVPLREGADARFEYVDSLGHAKVDNVVSIVCRRVAPQWVCVVLEYRVDDPTPASHRALQAQVLESLRPVPVTPKAK